MELRSTAIRREATRVSGTVNTAYQTVFFSEMIKVLSFSSFAKLAIPTNCMGISEPSHFITLSTKEKQTGRKINTKYPTKFGITKE